MSEVKESNEIIEEIEAAAGDESPVSAQADNQPDAVVEVLEGEIVAEGDELVDEQNSEAAVEEEISPEAALIEQLQAELAEVRAEAAAQTDQVQRIAAEFQNSKKRQERQLSDAIQRASGHLAEQLLPILDDFDLAFGNLPEELNEEDVSWVDGFRQIQKKLASLLDDQGVTIITGRRIRPESTRSHQQRAQ